VVGDARATITPTESQAIRISGRFGLAALRCATNANIFKIAGLRQAGTGQADRLGAHAAVRAAH
jgi:hypothetical protein